MRKLLIADDHELVSHGLTSFISQDKNLAVVGTASNGREVLDFLANHEVDLVILDLNMPEMNGLECMKVIHRRFPLQKVLILTIYQEEYVIRRLINLKVKGIMNKSDHLKEIVQAIHTICNGGTHFIGIDLSDSSEQQPITLTAREKQVISLIAAGLSNAEIGSKLHISEFTVSTHRKNVMKKLNFTNIAQLVSFVENSGVF
jgi:DNA-binding NarL/FixJ family response regulator